MRVLLLILISVLVAGCAAVQGDLVALQADIQAHKAELIPRVQAGIAFAEAHGDQEWVLCQRGILTLLQQPATEIPDLTNPFIRIEIEHQLLTQDISDSQTIRSLNLACAPWWARVKLEAAQVAMFVLGFFK